MFKRFLAALFALVAATAFAAADVNKATPAELEAVKGIGPAIAGKIVDERKKGNFKDWGDLVDRVKGIGEANAAKFSSEGLTVNGQTFKGVAAKPEAKPAADKPAPKAATESKPADKAATVDKAANATAAAAPKAGEKAEAVKASDKPAAGAKAAAPAVGERDKAAAKSGKKAEKAEAAASAAAKK